MSQVKNLVIVESPAKAKTIEKYLGDGFVVKSSMGHIRDLVDGDKGVDIKNNFEPNYDITEGKQQLVKELSELSRKAELVWLATDDDREGESISWHLKEALKIPAEKVKRIVFREITKTAILKAVENPRSIDEDLVNAQQARRVLDRIVGYELSPVLWKKIKGGLSAGRVQSVAVRLVVEREKEIEKFQSEAKFKTTGHFKTGKGKALAAELNKDFLKEDEVREFLEDSIGCSYRVISKDVKDARRSPAPPFTTSTLQQEASRKLSMSVSRTMSVAQKLYEAGYISYMRTDSTNLSDEALNGAASAIRQDYGDQYAQRRVFKTKNQGAQEAHEAIRPTDFRLKSAGKDSDEKRLYELIWKRAIASQMSDAILEKTNISIQAEGSRVPKDNEKLRFQASGEVVKFDGFLTVYLESSDAEEENQQEEGKEKMLPFVEVGEKLELNEIQSRQRYSRPPARFTEASLVKELEERGIGRPSTYAPTVSTIEKRDYVVKEWRDGKPRKYSELILKNGQISTNSKTEMAGAEKGKLFPTDMGRIVTDFLNQRFVKVMDYDFTKTVEEEFDHIARGKMSWREMIKAFYTPFHKAVEDTGEIERPNSERVLGKDPATGLTVLTRLGQYGPIAQLGTKDENAKPAYASLRKDQRIDSITLEEALALFDLPRIVGEFEGLPMQANNGRFGPYIKHGSLFASLKKGMDPYTIDAETAIQLIKDKRQADIDKVLKTFPENPDVRILKGRWGPFLGIGKDSYKLPKGSEVDKLNLAECLAIAEAQGGGKSKTGKKSGKAASGKSAAKKPAAKKK